MDLLHQSLHLEHSGADNKTKTAPVILIINRLCPSDAAGASAGPADGDPAGRRRPGATPGSGLEDPPRRLKVPQRRSEHQRSRCRRQQRQPR